ncbi:MAG: TIGR03943 family protein [Cyanobacteriota bacterium]|nr:TIGR03943 family protein [Cyanobacteriota bacterium]
MAGKKSPNLFLKKIAPWLDALAILGWGFLLLKYWQTGKLYLLIHPNYFALTVVGGIVLVILGVFKVWQLLKSYGSNRQQGDRSAVGHFTLFSPGWSSSLLLITAILGILITPKVFASHTALERGLTESLPVTRAQPKEFRTASRSQERSLIEWLRTLNVYPEPDAYNGQLVKVTGFVIYPPGLSEQYFWISRFIITCCAADAYPVGLPVKLPTGTREDFPPDSWLEVEGVMITEELNGQRKLTISPSAIKMVPEPKNPYDY